MVLGLYGAGGFGKETFDMIKLHLMDNWEEVVFIDDSFEGKELKGARVISYSDFKNMYLPKDACIAITQGEPRNKKILYYRVKSDGYGLPVLVHPKAYVADDADLDEGVIIFTGSTISSSVRLGKCVTTLTNTLVGHDVIVRDFCQISAMVLINGNTVVNEEAFIGGGAILRERIAIGKKSVVAMGACVMKNVPDGVIVMGNPARVIQKRSDDTVFKNGE